MCDGVEIWESVLIWKRKIGLTHAELNEDLVFGLIEFAMATNDAITFLELLEMSEETGAMWRTLAEPFLEEKQIQIVKGETSNIGETANEFISVEESGKNERVVKKSEHR